jgi:hypothetical protein
MREEQVSDAVREFEGMIQQELERRSQVQRIVDQHGNWKLEPVARSIFSKTDQYAKMATEGLKSVPITALDTLPIVAGTTGITSAFTLRGIDAYITPTSGVTVGSIYRMVRLPTTAKVKVIIWGAAAMTQGPFDVGVYYSTSTLDGTPLALQGTVVDADRFASAVSAASAVPDAIITNESGLYLLNSRGFPLWQAAGLTADPGGCLDIVLTSTNTITAGALVYILVLFSE